MNNFDKINYQMDFLALNKFLMNLSKNNNKEWFDKNRPAYESLRKEWIGFVGELIEGIQKFDPQLGHLEASKCIFRINKDIRFSKDKTPYKTNFGAIMNRGGKKELFSGYYFHIDHKEIFVAGGAYQPTPELLHALRQEVDYHFDEFKGLMESKSMLKYFSGLEGEKLSRPPKGYEANNPAIEYLKHKSFVVTQKYALKDAVEKSFKRNVLQSFEAMKPLNDFINRCLEA